MSTRNAFALATLLLSLVLLPAAPAFLQPAAFASADDATSSAPLMFIENVGQFDAHARFQMLGAGEMLWLAEDAIWITVIRKEEEKEILIQSHPQSSAHGVNLKLTFPGANSRPLLEPFDRLDTTVSYFTGSDPAGWHADVPVWSGVRYVDLYPGVDLEIGGQGGRWSWRLIQREAPSSIERPMLRIEGADGVTVDTNLLRLQSGNEEYVLPLLTVDGVLSGSASVAPVDANAFNVALPFVLSPFEKSPPSSDSPEDDPADLLYSTYLGEAWS